MMLLDDKAASVLFPFLRKLGCPGSLGRPSKIPFLMLLFQCHYDIPLNVGSPMQSGKHMRKKRWAQEVRQVIDSLRRERLVPLSGLLQKEESQQVMSLEFC